MTLGERIKNRRVELGLSVDLVAEKLNKNRATIYRYESDDIDNLPTTVLEPLAQILQTTPAYLMGWKDEVITQTTRDMLLQLKRIPIIKWNEAGKDDFTDDDIEGWVLASVPRGGDYFGLRVMDDSMDDSGISPGDLVVVQRNSEPNNDAIVVAEDPKSKNVVLRYLRHEQSKDNHYWYLEPANSEYEGVAVYSNTKFFGVLVDIHKQAKIFEQNDNLIEMIRQTIQQNDLKYHDIEEDSRSLLADLILKVKELKYFIRTSNASKEELNTAEFIIKALNIGINRLKYTEANTDNPKDDQLLEEQNLITMWRKLPRDEQMKFLGRLEGAAERYLAVQDKES